MFPNDQKVNGGLSYGVRYAGLLEESISLMEKNISLESDPYEKAMFLADIARAYFYMGKTESGRRKFDEVLEFIQSEGIETSAYLLFADIRTSEAPKQNAYVHKYSTPSIGFSARFPESTRVSVYSRPCWACF